MQKVRSAVVTAQKYLRHFGNAASAVVISAMKSKETYGRKRCEKYWPLLAALPHFW
jgi:hypothetical protein